MKPMGIVGSVLALAISVAAIIFGAIGGRARGSLTLLGFGIGLLIASVYLIVRKLATGVKLEDDAIWAIFERLTMVDIIVVVVAIVVPLVIVQFFAM